MAILAFTSFLFVKEELNMLESTFKTQLAKDIEKRFPGSMVLHLDPNEIQGIPDLLVLYKNRWAALEGKKDYKTYLKDSGKRPNQPYYVNLMNNMSYASFVYPENKEEVLNAMERSFEAS